ncbi:hypothetical protein M011DRAFT_413349 [Sporormia fimetaria CBS 119925]|uniref:Uncharacterized protein n=1 Tax=Sporormia fimetaria CBS 119925 TaxID=1340428 RepID=A0A6A6UWB1_9PLEO|nr:hypothetical protein M011DRAFT_413349 [Sporormia fimetaria CBS 119925]
MSHLFRFGVLLGAASFTQAALPIPSIIPFSVVGLLDSCQPEGTDYNAGGTVSVNSFNIKVPKNLITQFPVAWVPFKQLCDEANALQHEVSVAGNVVNGQAIAGQITVSAPVALEGSEGYIEEVNIEGAYLKIRGGPRVRINDPEGVFAKPLNERPLFLADTASPSITSFTGFPMCIPRSDNDELCPASNRPAGSTIFAAPDPLVMSPFRAGDFIQYSGLKGSNGDILAWEITAVNVQITTTASDTVPNYIKLEDALIGVFDTANNIETADIRFIGMVTSCAGTSVSISAIDVDPCTGEETYRQIGTATPRAGDARCRWEFRIDTTQQSTYTREYIIRANNPVITTKNGIKAGQYITPVGEWIQPEVNIPGTEPRPYRFDNIRGLVQGDAVNGKRFQQLDPFPGPQPPAPAKTCPLGDIEDPEGPEDPENPEDGPAVPVASVIPITTVQRGGAQIFLSASNTEDDVPASDLAFSWTKTAPASATVSIQSAASPSATVNLPRVTTEQTFNFTVTVSRKSNSTLSSTAVVSVRVSPTALDTVVLDAYTWESRQSGTIGVTCRSNVVNGDNTGMSLLLNNGATRLAMTRGTAAGRWTYNGRSTPRPTNVQCQSNFGGRSALVTAPLRRRKRGLFGRRA